LLEVNAEQSFTAQLSIHTLDGKLLFQQQERISEGSQRIELEVASLSNGIYLVRLEGKQEHLIRKLVVAK